jgi:2'-5' RNA ligase
MDKPRALRLFFALWPGETVRAALAGLQRDLRGRPTARENLHLTMAFLGAQPEGVLPALRETLAGMPSPDITLVIDRIGYFSRARIVWAGLSEAPPGLREWQTQLAAKLVAQGVGHDREFGFTPHVTLMRNAAPPEMQAIDPIRWEAPRLVLVSSETRPEGPRYELIAAADSADSADSAGAAGAA